MRQGSKWVGNMPMLLNHRWGVPHEFKDEEKEQQRLQQAASEQAIKEGTAAIFPAGANVELCKALFGAVDAMKGKWATDSMYSEYSPRLKCRAFAHELYRPPHRRPPQLL